MIKNEHSFFMPKLAPARIQQNRRQIEAAALRAFTRQGFHGTNIREIAREAGVSTGNIYNYYPTKEALFASLVRHHELRLESLRQKMFSKLRRPLSPGDLAAMAREIRSIVYDNAEYWLLMYIDVIEFENRHFAQTFQNLAAQLRQRLGPLLDREARDRRWCGLDPALVFATIYLHIFTYFLVEKLFRGHRHLGMSDEEAIRQLIRLYVHGLWRSPRPLSSGLEKKSRGLANARRRAGGKS